MPAGDVVPAENKGMSGTHELPTVLVVDDEERLRKALSRSLRQEKWRTYAAASGAEALGVLRERKIDLVITDLVMPGMDGMTLVRRIRRADPGMKVIIITAYGSTESMAEAEALGVSCYLAKPFDLSHLKSKVKELLSGFEAARGSSSSGPSQWGRSDALRSACSGAGKMLGGLVGVSRKVLACISPRNVLLAARRVTGTASEVGLGVQEDEVEDK